MWVALVDFYQSNAKTSLLYGYCRPQIDMTQTESSVRAKKLRHPLIEQIQERCQYVPQNLELYSLKKGFSYLGSIVVVNQVSCSHWHGRYNG